MLLGQGTPLSTDASGAVTGPVGTPQGGLLGGLSNFLGNNSDRLTSMGMGFLSGANQAEGFQNAMLGMQRGTLLDRQKQALQLAQSEKLARQKAYATAFQKNPALAGYSDIATADPDAGKALLAAQLSKDNSPIMVPKGAVALGRDGKTLFDNSSDGEDTADIKNLAFLNKQRAAAGQPPMGMDQFKTLSAQNISVNTAMNPVLNAVKERLDSSTTEAKSAADTIRAVHNARSQLDANGGIISGALANDRLKLQKLADLFGIGDSEKITNSETFLTAIKPQVIAMMKATGTNPSNADREFSAMMSGGDIRLQEAAIRRTLDFNEQNARGTIQRHNSLVGGVMQTLPKDQQGYSGILQIQEPGPYEISKARPQAPAPDVAAPAQYSRTATNPKTGQKIGLNPATNRWEPIKNGR